MRGDKVEGARGKWRSIGKVGSMKEKGEGVWGGVTEPRGKRDENVRMQEGGGGRRKCHLPSEKET